MQHTDPLDISFSTHPSRYNHLSLTVAGDEALITLVVNPEKNLRGDTPLKLNSYDLSVDIELADAIMRLRFEHPNVSVVTITSGHPQVFSSGANIYMLKKSSHAFKVNFCKFTNETRLYIEEASRFSHKKFLCALNGTAAGGGYELALACDRIVLVDDKSSNISLPEVPLLGVLPGTGGLTRVIEKRGVRRDRADIFCTLAEGIKGAKAKEWRLVDEVYPKSAWEKGIKEEVGRLKQNHAPSVGITLDDVVADKTSRGFSYRYVDVECLDNRVAKITLKAPFLAEPTHVSAMMERGSDLWLIRAFRELDDALLKLRFSHRDHGLIEFRCQGDKQLILDAEAGLYHGMSADAHWFLRETLLHMGRVLRRLDVMSRSIVAVIEPGSAFAGAFAEILFIADRSYGLDNSNESITLSPINNGLLLTWNESTRLHQRYGNDLEKIEAVKKICDGKALSLQQAEKLGLLTFVLDEIDFSDELRLFSEERASLSPDALSAMEANLRIYGKETMATKIFGRLSAWQNWVFIRTNATGEKGALMSYGAESRPVFDWERC